MELILNTGDTIEVLDSSNEQSFIIICPMADAESVKSKITTENLKRATLGNQVLFDLIVEDICIGETDDGDAFITVTNRKRSDQEKLLERLAEQDAALVELAGMIVG